MEWSYHLCIVLWDWPVLAVLVVVVLIVVVVLSYHVGYVHCDGPDGLHGVDGDGAALFHLQLLAEALLQLLPGEVQLGVVVALSLETHNANVWVGD